MKFGLGIFPTAVTQSPAELGRIAEERGFDSLWFPEHTHMPLDHSPFARGELPPHYKAVLDPFVALAAAAVATERLLLGFGICLVTQRDPIVTAKAVATLDLLSGGRVRFGVGAGWNRPELENHGAPFDRRFGVMRERVEAMKAIWTSEVAEYHGRYVDFDPMWCWPKPAQRPHPPVVVGGNGPKVLDRVLRYGDEWMPNREWDLETRIPELRERAGRHVPVSYFAARPEPATLERLAAAGVDRIVLMLPQEGSAEGRADQLAALAGRFR